MVQAGYERARKKLSEEIRKLSREEQADPIDELLVLTYREPDPEMEKAWEAEIDRRIDAVERGEAKLIDAREHLQQYKKP